MVMELFSSKHFPWLVFDGVYKLGIRVSLFMAVNPRGLRQESSRSAKKNSLKHLEPDQSVDTTAMSSRPGGAGGAQFKRHAIG